MLTTRIHVCRPQLPVPAAQGSAVRRSRLPIHLPEHQAQAILVQGRDQEGENHPRRLGASPLTFFCKRQPALSDPLPPTPLVLVASTLPLVDALRPCRPLDVAPQRQTTHVLRCVRPFSPLATTHLDLTLVPSFSLGRAWTLVNAHELAIISGMATAYSLGAPYPQELENDSFALLCFRSVVPSLVDFRDSFSDEPADVSRFLLAFDSGCFCCCNTESGTERAATVSRAARRIDCLEESTAEEGVGVEECGGSTKPPVHL